MATLYLVSPDLRQVYETYEWRNAVGILTTAHPNEWIDIVDALRALRFFKSDVLKGGGSKGPIAHRIDAFLSARGWEEKKFATKIQVDGSERDSPTHKVDCVKGAVGLEFEWNNKDPFFDRDLNNFRLLFDLRVIDVGVIVTRSSHLQTIFKGLDTKVANKYGASTTHMDKLRPRVEGGGGGGCPILAFGITREIYVDDGVTILDQPSADDDLDSE